MSVTLKAMVNRVYVTNEAGHPLPVELAAPVFHYMHFESPEALIKSVEGAADIDAALNHYGSQSWELTAVTPTGVMYFKRIHRRH